MVPIRDETGADFDSIREVNRLAFGGGAEARLVDRLRAEGLVIASLVAEQQSRMTGHILFSALPIESSAETVRGAALAPMAVIPACQRQGVGSALVRAGLECCREREIAVVVVVGHPDYYPRFGFSPEKAACLKSPYSGSAFMALELRPSGFDRMIGTAKYPAAFAEL